MEGCKVLFVLGLGLCLVFDYVNANAEKEQPHLYILLSQRENMANELENLKAMQRNLEEKLKSFAWNVLRRNFVEADLFHVENVIAHIEKSSRESYQDYLQMKIKQKAQYEREMKDMLKKLNTAGKEEKAKLWSSYKKTFDALAVEKQKIEKEFANYIQAAKLNELRINEVKDMLNQEKEETIKTLEAAKGKYARTIKALTAYSNEGYKLVRIPEQTKINKLKHKLKEFVSMGNKKKQKNAFLFLTKTKLNSLLPKLYEESKFSPETDRKDMEDALAVMEMNAVIVRDEQNKQRKELLEKMKDKDLRELSDEEIASLQMINEKLAVTDMFQQEVTTRSAYLKRLLEVIDLMAECSDAINASQQGKIAKFLAEAIEEANNGNLAKLWTHA